MVLIVNYLNRLSIDTIGLLLVFGSIALLGLALAALFWVPRLRRMWNGQLHRLD